MKLSDAEIREVYQQMTAPEQASDCVSEDILIRAAGEELSGAERERVADHIAHCSDCSRAFRIVRALEPLAVEAGREGTRTLQWLAVAAAALLLLAVPALVWMILLRQRDVATIERLRAEVGQLRSRAPVVTRATPPQTTTPAPDVRALESTIAELSRPHIDVPIVDLDADVVRGSGDPRPTISVPPAADAVALILHLPEETSAPVAIDILDAGGAVVAKESVPPRRGRSSISLVLNRRILSEGENAIDVRSGGTKTSFRFRVDYP